MAMLIAAVLALAAAPAATPAAKPATLQATFDAASVANNVGRFADALAGFESLEGRPAVTRNRAVAGAIKARKATALYALDRIDEARSAAKAAMELLPDEPAYGDDRIGARVLLARIALRGFDQATARAEAHAALAIAKTPEQRVLALSWAVRATMFDDGPQALTFADRLVAEAAALPGATAKDTAVSRILRARVLLNHGNPKLAYAELKKVLADRGGLTLKVSLDDVVMRSDLAIAALLAGDPDEARKYLAYTGAGRLEKAPFATAAEMRPPPCGGDGGLTPDDVAVVEFSVADDGSVASANPIYASRLGPAAQAFAEAVGEWAWTRENATAIPPFFRAVSRVELRCTTASERPATAQRLQAALADWLDTRNVAEVEEKSSLAALQVELAKREKAGGGLALVPVLLALAGHRDSTEDGSTAAYGRARDILAASAPPVAAIAYVDVQLLEPLRPSERRERLRALLADPKRAADADTADTLRLMIAERGYRLPPPRDASALLRAVADDARLPKEDALRVGALLRLATLQAGAGDLTAARTSYAATGLDAQQCALVDAKPVMRSTGASSSDYPMAAMQWGFEGWVRTEFDVRADGRTANQRAIIAYPPFVFREAGVGIAKDARYQQSYRPTGGLGCSGQTVNINFRLPG